MTAAGSTPFARAMIGQSVDRYLIEGELGTGGFGTVYRARHAVLGTEVAVKLLWPSHLGSPEVVQRFLQEARAAASIGHHHIVQVLDAGRTPDGLPFLVMELLEGRDLDTWLKQSRTLDVETTIDIGVQVLDALAAAHERGIVHRDLKPANVFVSNGPDGRPFAKLLDFGISKVLGAAGTLTQTGSLVGTPHYMAPEQLDGARGLDARADLFAVGVMLYRMLTGVLPLEGEGYGVAIRRLQGETGTPLRERAPHVPPSVAQIVTRATALDAAFRWPSATAMADALIDASAQLLPGGTAANVATVPPMRSAVPSPTPAPATASHAPAAAMSPMPVPATGPAAPPHPWLVAARPSPSSPPRPVRRPVPGYLWGILGAALVMGAIGLGAMIVVGVRELRESADKPSAPVAAPPVLGSRSPSPEPSIPTPMPIPMPAPSRPPAPVVPPPPPAHAADVRYTIADYVGMGPRSEIQTVFERARAEVARCGRPDRAHDVSVDFIATIGGAITISHPNDERPSTDPSVAECVASAIPAAGPASFTGMQTAIVTVDVHVPAL